MFLTYSKKNVIYFLFENNMIIKNILIIPIILSFNLSFAATKDQSLYATKVDDQVKRLIIKDIDPISTNRSASERLHKKTVTKKDNLILETNDNNDNNKFLINTITDFKTQKGVELFGLIGSVYITTTRQVNINNNHSTTNGNNKECYVNLSYVPVEFWTSYYKPQKELYFSLVHELSHCILGKDMFKGMIEWEIDIEDEKKKKINELALSKSIESWVLMKQGVKKINPLVVYHETFADIFSILYLYQKKVLNKENVLAKINIRKVNCEENGFCHYQIYKYKNEIMDLLNKIDKENIEMEKIFFFSNLFSNKSLLENL